MNRIIRVEQRLLRFNREDRGDRPVVEYREQGKPARLCHRATIKDSTGATIAWLVMPTGGSAHLELSDAAEVELEMRQGQAFVKIS